MTIGIWGSCVTRDTFELGGENGHTVSYHARSAWVSQASARISPAPVTAPAGTGFGDRMVREDLHKSVVQELAAATPELVVIDLIDERFDVVSVEGSWFTVNDYYERGNLDEPLRTRAASSLAFRQPERDELFADAAAGLVPELLAALPSTRFALHAAWYTARSADPHRPFYASAPSAVAWCNRRLAHHYSVLLKHFGGRLNVIQPDRSSCLVGDPDHKWGLAHYHYVGSYYEQALRQINDIRRGAGKLLEASDLRVPSPQESGELPPTPAGEARHSGMPDRPVAVPKAGRTPRGPLRRASGFVRSAVRRARRR